MATGRAGEGLRGEPLPRRLHERSAGHAVGFGRITSSSKCESFSFIYVFLCLIAEVHYSHERFDTVLNSVGTVPPSEKIDHLEPLRVGSWQSAGSS